MNSCTPSDPELPTVENVRAAANRIEGRAVRTPLLESSFLNERLDARILFKPECLQKTGSFKYRGASNFIASMDDEQRKRGVVAFSSGNHAQGVAAAAREAGVPALIVMPKDAPGIKIRNTRSYGAEIVLYDRYTEDREEICRQYREERGAVMIRPYDDPLIMAGQGTIGLEIADQCRHLDIVPDALLSPCGGGGLMSGISLALNDAFPDTALYAVEPEGFEDTLRSLESGNREANRPEARSICDALLSPMPGELTFQINRKLLSGAFSVTDEQVTDAMRFAFSQLKLVVEPGGAVALSAILEGKLDVAKKTVVAVLSGGNVDAEIFQRILSN